MKQCDSVRLQYDESTALNFTFSEKKSFIIYFITFSCIINTSMVPKRKWDAQNRDVRVDDVVNVADSNAVRENW